MPYQDKQSQLWINADVYLTNHESLCELLQIDNSTADAKLILLAYIKYGVNCLDYFSGYFSFVIYNPLDKSLFAAVDQFSNNPLYYSYEEGKQFICANEFSPFRKLSSQLTINEKHFLEITFDTFSLTETSYQEVFRLKGGHYLIVDQTGCQEHCYWELKRSKLPKMNREGYYQEFRNIFYNAVNSCLRNNGENCSQISGGMDSSSVTAQAAIILAKENRILYSFTALPNNLEGPSNRKNWYYHELPIVKSVLKMYPTVAHYQHYSEINKDIYLELDILNSYIDQPIRNVANIEWILSSYQFATKNNSKVILTGASGNATISWTGESLRNKLGKIRSFLKLKLKPTNAFSNFFTYANHDVLQSRTGQQLIFNRGFISDSQAYMLTRPSNALKSTAYALQLWYGTKSLDPTTDKDLVKFCHSLPQWVFYTDNKTINRRLLIREGLRDILPTTITQSIASGEQASDFYLSYNMHQQQWLDRLNNLKPATQAIIWKYFNKDKMLGFFKQYP
jgi:asparagine synthase (glutamine-hydrolysing)